MSDYTADSFDHASLVEDAFREAAIKQIRTQAPIPKDFDGETCYDCGVDIPQARLALGKWTCVSCQTARESKEKQFWRKA